MTNVNLSAVDSLLSFYDNNLTNEVIDAYQMTMSYAQYLVRKVNSDPTSQIYFSEMKKQLSNIGWTVLIDISIPTVHWSEIKPIDVITSCLPGSIGATEVKSILNAMTLPNSTASSLCDFFWQQSTTNINGTRMGIGRLIEEFGVPSIALGFSTFDVTSTSFDSFLNSKISLNVQVETLGMTLDMSTYKKHENSIKKELKDYEQDHVKNAKLSF